MLTFARAGRFVELVLKGREKFLKGLSSASKSLRDFGAGARAVGSAIFLTGAALVAPFAASVKAAGDLNETVNRFEAVFGDSAVGVRKWADEWRKQVGRAEDDTLAALSSFQGIFSGLEFPSDEAAEFAKEMAALSVDFASFNNLTDEEGMQRFLSGLSGSSEVFDKFGINIKEQNLNMKLMEMGFETIAGGATEAQKVLARMEIIRETMGRQGAIGDAIKTSGGFVNQLKAMQAAIKDAAAEIGNALLPTATLIVSRLRAAIAITGKFIAENKGLILVAAGVAVAILGIGAAITGIGIVATIAGYALATLAGILGLLTSPLALIAGGLVAGAFLWTRYTDSGRAALNGLTDLLSDLKDTALDTFSGISDALTAGDIGLAAEIAGEALKLAFFQTLDALSQAFGDTFGAISDLLLKGDFAGAWNIVVTQMHAVWAEFAAGVVTLFGDAAKSVSDIWKTTVESLAKFMLDFAQEIFAQFETNLRLIEKLVPSLAPQTKRARESVSSIVGFDATAFAAGGAGEAGGMVGGIVDQQNKDFLASIDAFASSLAERAADVRKAADSLTTGGTSAISGRVAESQARLDALREKAAAAAEEAAARRAKEREDQTKGDTVASARGATGTFASSSAIGLAFGAQSPDKEIAKNTREALAVLREMLKVDKTIAAAERSAILLTE